MSDFNLLHNLRLSEALCSKHELHPMRMAGAALRKAIAEIERLSLDREAAEDAEFWEKYTDARAAADYEWTARVLSGRLHQMDLRAKAANARADAAERLLAKVEGRV